MAESRSRLQRHFEGFDPIYDNEIRMRHKEGHWVWIHDLGRVVSWTPEGRAHQMYGTHTDITQRKRFEQALRESEQNFRSFFESITDIVLVCQPDGTILFANQAASSILDHPPEDLIGRNALGLHPPEYRAEAESLLRDMMAGEADLCNLPLQAAGGSNVAVESRIWSGRWNGSECFFALIKDVSSEEEANQRFEQLFRNSPV
ncbi:MAG: PAS domain S-box protein, partial [Anaerolineae bacterium]